MTFMGNYDIYGRCDIYGAYRASNEYNEHFVLHSSHNPENDHWLVDDLMGEDYYHYSRTAVVNCSMAGFAFEESHTDAVVVVPKQEA